MKLLSKAAFVALVYVTTVAGSNTGLAETIYVTDEWKFEMRERPCPKCKILIYNLLSGTKLEKTGVVEGEWIQLRTADGLVGWMPENYLSTLPAARGAVAKAEQAETRATIESDLAKKHLEMATRELQDAGIEIEIVTATAEDGVTSIQVPRIIGNLSALGRQNSELLERVQVLQNELDIRGAEIDRLTDSEKQQSFAYGAIAVLAGAILAVLLPRIRPRKLHSEWA